MVFIAGSVDVVDPAQIESTVALDEAATRSFLDRCKVRVCCICLERRMDRWQVAQSHAEAELLARVPWRRPSPTETHVVTEPSVEFCMGGGVDAHAHIGLLASDGLEAVEAVLRCRVYRGWPICDEYDVLRLKDEDADPLDATPTPTSPLSGADGARLWMEYRSWLRQQWHSRLAEKYFEYFNRHTTLGEVGSSLAHFEVAERAAAPLGQGGVDVVVVFEDDARPSRDALPALFSQIIALESRGIQWDLIYIASRKYDKEPEEEALASCSADVTDATADEAALAAVGLSVAPPLVLRRALHRKVCAAYALSRRGADRIASSGFRQSLFAYDDFLPALHSRHPRPDVLRLPCVRAARRADVEDADEWGFRAFTFPDDDSAILCNLSSEEAAVSDNNRSPCVVGDHGVEVDC